MHQFFVENQALFQDRSSFFKVDAPPIPLWGVLDVLLSNLHQRGTNLYSGVSAL